MSSLFNPTHLLHLCQKYNLHPSKKYGQNYLIDPEVIETIVAAAELKKDDMVVEVGPGFGVLTAVLAPEVKQVIAFEIEKKLQPYWTEIKEIEKYRNIEIVWGNVLMSLRGGRNDRRGNPPVSRTNFFNNTDSESNGIAASSRCESGLLAMTRYKVVANLPYQITSPVIRLFLELENPPTEMVLMVQKEVAERICAKAGDMSLLSVAVQYYTDAKIIQVVPRASFWPVPQVDSAVIKIKIKKEKLKNKEFDEMFFKIVKAGFAQRRKLLSKNLEPVIGKKNKAQFLKIVDELALLPTVRAQELSVEQWKELVHKVSEVKSL